MCLFVCVDGPSWFVATMWFYYWCFPSLLPKLQRYTIDDMNGWIIKHYWIQLIVGGVLSIAVNFWMGTFWPPARFPVFIMGVLAGLIRIRDPDKFEPYCTKLTTERTEAWWAKRNDLEASIMIILFGIWMVLDNLYEDAGGNLWLQLYLPISQITLIYGLTCENSESPSTTTKILTTKFLLFFGKISYPLYLVHEPLIQYFAWMFHGALDRPTCEKDDDICQDKQDDYEDDRLIPLWSLPLVWLTAITIAILTHYFFEEPLRKYFKPARK